MTIVGEIHLRTTQSGALSFTGHRRDMGGRVIAEWFDNDLGSKEAIAKAIHTINDAAKDLIKFGEKIISLW